MSRERLKISPEKAPASNWVSPRISLLNSDSEDTFFLTHLARKLIESSNDVLFLIDSRTGIILACSTRAEELLGEPAGTVTGRPYSAIRFQPAVRLHPGRFEAALQLGSGSEVPVEVSLNSFRTEGREFFQCAVRDITAIKRTESLLVETKKGLRHLQKMEAIGTLAGGIAHEFNNILAAILGYTEMTMQDLVDKRDIRGNLDHIFSAGVRAKGLIKQILTFSRQSEGDLMPIDLNPVIKETIRMLRATLPKNIEIRQNIRRDAGIVQADPIQMYQVLMNLCTNAVKAMGEAGGILSIELSDRMMDEKEAANLPELTPGHHLLLTVSDTGPGIEPDRLDHLFDPFFRPDRLGDGSGMGLSIAHGIIGKHRGAISVESRVGAGTSFRIHLPVVERDAGPNYRHLVEDMPRGSERILFIDDEEVLTALTGKMLQHLGYQVVTQTSSLEALKLFSSTPEAFDLIITDQGMPHLSGFGLARELRAIRKNIRIILCTGFNDSTFSARSRSTGIDEYVQKPILMQEMAAVIRRVLDSGR